MLLVQNLLFRRKYKNVKTHLRYLSLVYRNYKSDQVVVQCSEEMSWPLM